MSTLPFILIFAVAIFILLVILCRTLDKLRDRTRALGRIEMKLDLLMQRSGVDFPPYKGLPGDVVDALKRGQKIEAIKSYRAATGVGLKQAKERIEEIERGAGS